MVVKGVKCPGKDQRFEAIEATETTSQYKQTLTTKKLEAPSFALLHQK